MTGKFAASVAKFGEKAKKEVDKRVREITLNLFDSVITLSPVGNPELWKVNNRNVSLRGTYSAYAEAFNAQGDGRRISVSSRALDKKFGKLKKPNGYVGGAFRGAWTTTIGSPGTSPTDRIDPTGMKAKAEVRANVGGAGKVTYLTNSLPYGYRLEYEGWSKQAPAGFVRISMAKVSAFEKAK